MFWEGREGGEGRGAGDGLHAVEGPVDNCRWESMAEEKRAHIRSTTLKSGIIGTDAMEAKEKVGEKGMESLQDVGCEELKSR